MLTRKCWSVASAISNGAKQTQPEWMASASVAALCRGKRAFCATTYPQKGLTMADDGWKGGTDPQAYVDSLKQDALTMIEQQDVELVAELFEAIGNAAAAFVVRQCGISGTTQNTLAEKVAAHRIAAEARGMEKAAQIAEDEDHPSEWNNTRYTDHCTGFRVAREQTADAIRAALNGGQHE